MSISNQSSMRELLEYTISQGASDLHLAAGMAPAIRVDGGLKGIMKDVLTSNQLLKLIRENLPDSRIQEFERNRELDYSFGIQDLGRFRVNLYYHRGEIGCALRVLPFDPMSFDEIGFPRDVAEYLAMKPSGLILVTGPTGSGKTTTIASMIDHINENEACHIVTIEDPVEVVFSNKKSVIHQREVGSDTMSFNESLKRVLRQDPDVILIGEMRDLETIEIALTCAETGHLVFATLHTPDAVQSVNRVIDVFPAHQQQQVRVQLSFVLLSVISQQLLPKKGGGLTMAAEILIATPAVRTLIRESKSHQLYSSIQMGQKEGMRTLNMSLVELVRKGLVTKEEAVMRSSDPNEFDRLLLSR